MDSDSCFSSCHPGSGACSIWSDGGLGDRRGMLLNSNHPLQGGEIKERSCRCLVAVWRFMGAGTLPNCDCSVGFSSSGWQPLFPAGAGGCHLQSYLTLGGARCLRSLSLPPALQMSTRERESSLLARTRTLGFFTIKAPSWGQGPECQSPQSYCVALGGIWEGSRRGLPS